MSMSYMSSSQQPIQYSGWFSAKDKSHFVSNMPRHAPPNKTTSCPSPTHLVYSRTHASSFHAEQLRTLGIAEPCPSHASSMLGEIVGIEAGLAMALTVVLAALSAKLDTMKKKNRTL